MSCACLLNVFPATRQAQGASLAAASYHQWCSCGRADSTQACLHHCLGSVRSCKYYLCVCLGSALHFPHLVALCCFTARYKCTFSIHVFASGNMADITAEELEWRQTEKTYILSALVLPRDPGKISDLKSWQHRYLLTGAGIDSRYYQQSCPDPSTVSYTHLTLPTILRV